MSPPRRRRSSRTVKSGTAYQAHVQFSRHGNRTHAIKLGRLRTFEDAMEHATRVVGRFVPKMDHGEIVTVMVQVLHPLD